MSLVKKIVITIVVLRLLVLMSAAIAIIDAVESFCKYIYYSIKEIYE